MMLIALLGRGVFWLSALFIVGTAVVSLWSSGSYLLALLAVPFFPITYFVFPWISGLHWVFLFGAAGYVLSTTLGMQPVD